MQFFDGAVFCQEKLSDESKFAWAIIWCFGVLVVGFDTQENTTDNIDRMWVTWSSVCACRHW